LSSRELRSSNAYAEISNQKGGGFGNVLQAGRAIVKLKTNTPVDVRSIHGMISQNPSVMMAKISSQAQAELL
jgi:hypothetical protein